MAGRRVSPGSDGLLLLFAVLTIIAVGVLVTLQIRAHSLNEQAGAGLGCEPLREDPSGLRATSAVKREGAPQCDLRKMPSDERPPCVRRGIASAEAAGRALVRPVRPLCWRRRQKAPLRALPRGSLGCPRPGRACSRTAERPRAGFAIDDE